MPLGVNAIATQVPLGLARSVVLSGQRVGSDAGAPSKGTLCVKIPPSPASRMKPSVGGLVCPAPAGVAFEIGATSMMAPATSSAPTRTERRIDIAIMYASLIQAERWVDVGEQQEVRLHPKAPTHDTEHEVTEPGRPF